MSDTSTVAIVRRRRKALAKISRLDPLAAPVLVHDPETQLPTHGGGSVRRFQGAAYVWDRTFPGVDDRDAKSVWVASDDGGYAEIYKAFLTETYGVSDFACLSRTAPVAERHFIDHVSGRVELSQNYQDTKSGTPISAENQRYHILEAVPSRANSSGGGSEKKMSRSTVASSSQRPQRLLRITHLMKLYGLMTPRTKDDATRYAEAIRVLGGDGWPAAEIREGLDTLIELAAFRAEETA